MIRFGIKYENLIKANKEHPIDEAYKLILAIKYPWESLDSIIDFVRRWDFRVPIRNNENKIKEFLLGVKTEFVALEKFNIEDLDFNSQNRSLHIGQVLTVLPHPKRRVFLDRSLPFLAFGWRIDYPLFASPVKDHHRLIVVKRLQNFARAPAQIQEIRFHNSPLLSYTYYKYAL